jgi:hypothetical protein
MLRPLELLLIYHLRLDVQCQQEYVHADVHWCLWHALGYQKGCWPLVRLNTDEEVTQT